MANFIASKKINIFPAARSDDYPNAYRLSEQTITELIRSLLSNQDGFVIGNPTFSLTPGDTANYAAISCILGGYLISFNTIDLPAPDNSGDMLWACIKLSSSGPDSLLSLDGVSENGTSETGKNLDYAGTFYGVSFEYNNNRPTGITYALPILEKVGQGDAATWRVPEDSKLQFTTTANTRAIKIDDGDLTPYNN